MLLRTVTRSDFVEIARDEIANLSAIKDIEYDSKPSIYKCKSYPDSTISVYHTSSQWTWRVSNSLRRCISDSRYNKIGIDGLLYINPNNKSEVGTRTVWIKDEHDALIVILALTEFKVFLADTLASDSFLYSIVNKFSSTGCEKRVHHIHSRDDNYTLHHLLPGDVLVFRANEKYRSFGITDEKQIAILTTLSINDYLQKYKQDCWDGKRFYCHIPYYTLNNSSQLIINPYGISYYQDYDTSQLWDTSIIELPFLP